MAIRDCNRHGRLYCNRLPCHLNQDFHLGHRTCTHYHLVSRNEGMASGFDAHPETLSTEMGAPGSDPGDTGSLGLPERSRSSCGSKGGGSNVDLPSHRFGPRRFQSTSLWSYCNCLNFARFDANLANHDGNYFRSWIDSSLTAVR